MATNCWSWVMVMVRVRVRVRAGHQLLVLGGPDCIVMKVGLG